MNRSIAFNQIITSHRDIIFGLLQTDTLSALSGALNPPRNENDALKARYAGTLLLNHCMSMFYYLESGVIDSEHWVSFTADARDMFSLPLIQHRWNEVKNFYPETFRAFVETSLLAEKD